MFSYIATRVVPRARLPAMGYPAIGSLLIVATVLASLAGTQPARAGNEVTDWNQEFLNITQQTSGNLVAGPPEVAREIAIIGNAMSDAVNAATGGTISSYAYTGGTVLGADANVAAATAAYTALSSIFNDAAWQTPISTVTGSTTLNSSNVSLATNVILPQLSTFLTSELKSLGLTSPGSCTNSLSSLCLGYNLGIATANAVTKKQSSDGAVASIQNGLLSNKPTTGPNLQPGTSGTTPGVYVPPATRPEMFPTWGGVTPTSLSSAQLSAVKGTVTGPPAIGSQAYATALLQTECQGSSLGQSNLSAKVQAACGAAGFTQTAAQAKADATAALFWNDPGTTVQPPGHWLQIADSAMKSQNTSLLQSAQLTAILGEAQTDAGIAAWGEKYTYNLWRPVTAIHACDASNTGSVAWSSDFTTCDATWSALIATPPHPDYLAGHPAFSQASAEVLADFFRTDNIAVSSTSDYYCNGAKPNFNAANLVVSCTAGTAPNTTTYYICSATTTPDFVNGVPVDCTDGTHTFALTGAFCNTITTTGINNASPLICPITETFNSFSAASSGPSGSEFSRVVGGIHTPFSVTDALTLGGQVGTLVAVNNGLPDLVPEPSSLSLCAVSLLALTRLRRRRAQGPSVRSSNIQEACS
jgi:hypothetical protein